VVGYLVGTILGGFVTAGIMHAIYSSEEVELEVANRCRIHRQEAAMAEVGSLIDELETERIWLRDVIYANVDEVAEWDQEHRRELRLIEERLVSLHDVRVVLIADSAKRKGTGK